jgi:hypothetical protein
MKNFLVICLAIGSINSFANPVTVCANVVQETRGTITYEPTQNFEKDAFAKGPKRICKAFGQGSVLEVTYSKSHQGTQLTGHGWYIQSGIPFKVIDSVTCSKN